MKRAALLGSALAVLATATVTTASPVLVDRNSTLEVDPYSPAGLYNWTVDGVDAMRTESFWYRIGDTGPEHPVSDLVLVQAVTSDGDLGTDPGDDTLLLLYADQYDPQAGVEPNWTIRIRYMLTGSQPGSSHSALGEQVHVRNYMDSMLDFHLFEYNDIELSGTPDDDTVRIHPPPGSNVADQFDPDGVALTTEAVSPYPSHYQAALGPTLLDELTDDSPTTLTDDTGPYVGDGVWAFEWDWAISGHGSFILSKVKEVHVPEPATMGLLACGAIAALVRRRRRTAA
jgi:hypothetical protein